MTPGTTAQDSAADMSAGGTEPGTSIIERWYADFIEQGGRAGRGVDYIVQQAQIKAHQYRELGTAYDDFQPGNGTSYKVVLHDLVRPQADLELRRHMTTHVGVAANPVCRCVDGEPVDLDYFRPIAAAKGMSGRAGGELLVSLPENSGGRCTVLSVFDGALYTPDYIGEALGIRLGDAVPLAAYLTAFVSAVAGLRVRGGSDA